MNFTTEQVDLIVQRVLEHLDTPGSAAPAATGSAGHALDSAAPNWVQLSEAVVTQALLAEAIKGAIQVRIGPKAILTPSARDFVRHRGIEVIREPSSLAASVSLRWQIIATVSTTAIAAVVEGLKMCGIAAGSRLLGLPAEAASQAIGAVCRGEAARVVVFTSEPELVACLSNRNDRVRAANVADSAAAERVQRTLNPNLIAIDPSGKGVHELKALLKAFTLS
jgi:hypothetical protein